jgi:hypothetical protein
MSRPRAFSGLVESGDAGRGGQIRTGWLAQIGGVGEQMV